MIPELLPFCAKESSYYSMKLSEGNMVISKKNGKFIN